MDFIRVINKPIHKMTQQELKIEEAVHSWMRLKVKQMAFRYSMNLFAYRDKYPIYTKEELTQMYENGEISKDEYQILCAEMGKRRLNYQKMQARVEYASSLVEHETAAIVTIAEQITRNKAKPKPRKRGGRSYDPRKLHTASNMFPERYYENGIIPKPKIKTPKAKWNKVDQADHDTAVQLSRMKPISTWSEKKFRAIARDRGFFERTAQDAFVAQELGISVNGASVILKQGKMTWSQAILIASAFEMTPIEFCDIFLSDVFKEVVDGKYIAYIEEERKHAMRDGVANIIPSRARTVKSIGRELGIWDENANDESEVVDEDVDEEDE